MNRIHRIVLVLAALVPALHAGEGDRKKFVSAEFIGQVTFPTGHAFAGTNVGGLSGLTYDPATGTFYAISDDRSQFNPARFYTLTIAVADGSLASGDVAFTGVTTLLNSSGTAYPLNGVDPEGIAFAGSGRIFVSSEGNASALLDPFVDRFVVATGAHAGALPVDAKFLAAATTGIRNNLAFESLCISPDGRFLLTATESALKQDGPVVTLADGSLARIVKYDLATGLPLHEFVYVVEPIPTAPVPASGFADNGLVELLATDDDGSLRAMERSFASGVGNTVKLFEVRTQGALTVEGEFDLIDEDSGDPFEIDPPVAKRELFSVADFGVTPDNIEGMTFGPTLPDGRRTLILVSDNNFSPVQVTQFLAFAVEFETIPAVQAAAETPQATNDEDAAGLRGDSDDPAIWVHPTSPDESLVICAQKDGGLAVFDLSAQLRQTILPAPYGDVRYNNVDLVYNFLLGDRRVDLAVASDRANDTLVVFEIDPATRDLTDITSDGMLASIFGEDDGEHTCYGLATWTDPADGATYAFATQREGAQVAQLELTDDGDGGVDAEVVRVIALPVPTGDTEDSQAEGMVVDRERGILYVGLEGEVGVLAYDAAPDAGDGPVLILSIEEDFVEPDLEGLTIYYGPGGTGYLLVSSQGDGSFVVLDREALGAGLTGTDAYLGSFVVGGMAGVDQTNESDGADVINVPLGSGYPAGLLVVQDGADDPQNAVADDGELENNTTNFKFVPWDGVADVMGGLVVDPVYYDPRGPCADQVAFLISDVARFGIESKAIAKLLDQAWKHAKAGRYAAAAAAVAAFDSEVARLDKKDEIGDDAADALRAEAATVLGSIARKLG